MANPNANNPHRTLLHTIHGSQEGTAVVGNFVGTTTVLSYSNVHEGGTI